MLDPTRTAVPGPLAWLALVACAVLAAGCGRGASNDHRPNLILISIDTLRADHLGSYGYERPTSPALDVLASEGAVFENVSSTAPWTLPAHGSLLTGLYPSRHGLKSNRSQLPADVRTLAEILSERGFRTAAFVNSHYVSDRYGFARGFEQFEYIEENVASVAPCAVGDEAIAWLSKRQKRPFFLFLHTYDVHSDYRSLESYEQQFVRAEGRMDGTTAQLQRVRTGELELSPADVERTIDLYDAGIRQVDDQIDRLLRHLESKGLAKHTLVAVTSDHGEEFGEHGGVLHGRTQFEELIHVPLIMRGPGLPAGARVPTVASLIDVLPTLLGLLDIPVPAGVDGVFLGGAWDAEHAPPAPRFVFAEADHNNAEADIKRAVRSQHHKLHFDRATGELALYDLTGDAGEATDIAAQNAATVDVMRTQLERFMTIETTGQALPPLSDEEAEKLRTLGYF